MSEIEIDETTGLPRLPEGYFWRIRGEGHFYQKYPWGAEVWSGQISIYWKSEPGPWSPWEEAPIKRTKGAGYALNGKVQYEYRAHETTPSSRTLLGGWSKPSQRGSSEEYRHRASSSERYVFSSTQESDEGSPANKANLVNRCQEVLDAWNESIERKKIYGDYPPKRLGADD